MADNTLRILVVEDYLANQVILERFLTPYGRVDLAGNGEEAFRKYKDAVNEDDPYGVICLDIMLPKMDGHEVLLKIRIFERERNIRGNNRVKIIMTTALGDAKNIMTAFQGECEAYLQKPIRRDKLLAELMELGLIEDET